VESACYGHLKRGRLRNCCPRGVSKDRVTPKQHARWHSYPLDLELALATHRSWSSSAGENVILLDMWCDMQQMGHDVRDVRLGRLGRFVICCFGVGMKGGNQDTSMAGTSHVHN
jgi:hypothetical protein